MRPGLLVLLLSATLCACASAPPAPTFAEPSEWDRVDARGLFSFSLPPSLVAQEVQGTDSYVGEYRSETVRLKFDYGWYSDPLTLHHEDERGYTRRPVEVDGKSAYLVRYRAPKNEDGMRSVAALHVPQVVVAERNADGVSNSDTRLTMFATCRTEAACDAVEAVLLSVAFPE